MTAVLGSKPPAQNLEVEDFDKRILARGGHVVVINDEAHHTHDEDSEWNKVIRRLHADLRSDPSLPPPSQGGAGRGRRATRFHCHPSLQQGRAVHLDGLRLSAQASHH